MAGGDSAGAREDGDAPPFKVVGGMFDGMPAVRAIPFPSPTPDGWHVVMAGSLSECEAWVADFEWHEQHPGASSPGEIVSSDGANAGESAGTAPAADADWKVIVNHSSGEVRCALVPGTDPVPLHCIVGCEGSQDECLHYMQRFCPPCNDPCAGGQPSVA